MLPPCLSKACVKTGSVITGFVAGKIKDYIDSHLGDNHLEDEFSLDKIARELNYAIVNACGDAYPASNAISRTVRFVSTNCSAALIFSRLLSDRIIFLGEEVSDVSAQLVVFCARMRFKRDLFF